MYLQTTFMDKIWFACIDAHQSWSCIRVADGQPVSPLGDEFHSDLPFSSWALFYASVSWPLKQQQPNVDPASVPRRRPRRSAPGGGTQILLRPPQSAGHHRWEFVFGIFTFGFSFGPRSVRPSCPPQEVGSFEELVWIKPCAQSPFELNQSTSSHANRGWILNWSFYFRAVNILCCHQWYLYLVKSF